MVNVRMATLLYGFNVYKKIYYSRVPKRKEFMYVMGILVILLTGDYFNFKYYHAQTEYFLRKYAFQVHNKFLKADEEKENKLQKKVEKIEIRRQNFINSEDEIK